MTGGKRGQSPTLDDVRRWARAHPECTPEAITARFPRVKGATAREWHAELVAEGVLAPPSATGPRKSSTSAAQMAPDLRESARGMVSSAYKLVRLNLDRLLAQFEDDEDRVIGPDDKDTMTALRALQQVATGLVAAHPGLDAVTGAGDETDTVNEDDLERVRALLDAKGE